MCFILVCYSGSKIPLIKNFDRAVATTSKLDVGTYTFKLVVRDGEGLTDEDLVVITVKEGK